MTVSRLRVSWSVAILVLAAALVGGIVCSGPVLAIDIGQENAVANLLATEVQNQSTPSLAAYPGGYLLVYQDYRGGIDYDISGVFLDTNCNPVGGAFVISTSSSGGAAGDQKTPAAAWNGTNFLVVWSDNRSPYAATPKVYGTRVSSAGTVLDPNGLVVYTDSANGSWYPSVASNGTDWEVVWERDNGTSHDISASKVSAAGVVSSRVSVTTGTSEKPSVVWNGTYYMTVYQRSDASGYYDIWGTKLTSSGAVTGTAFLVSPVSSADTATGAAGDQMQARLAVGTGGTSLVVWQDNRNGSNYDIYGARVTSSGTIYDTDALPLYQSAGDQELPSVGFNGTNFTVCWRDRQTLPAKAFGVRVDTSGNVLDSPCLAISTGSPDRTSAIFTSGTSGSTLTTWAVSQNGVLDIYGSKVGSDGTVGAEKVLSVAGQDQPTYASAFDGTNYVVVWTDRRSANSAVYAARVNPFGLVLDPAGVLLSSSAVEQKDPTIAWNGSMYLVAWAEGSSLDSDIKGVRLMPNMTVIDATPLIIGTGDNAQYAPQVAWNGTNFMVVWSDTKAGTLTNQIDITGVRVNPVTGVDSTGPIGICTDSRDQFAPAISSNGSTWLVAWQDQRETTVVGSTQSPPTNTNTSSLTISPTTGWSSSGNVSGPFSPSSTTYTLTNPGTTSLSWHTVLTNFTPWITVSPSTGTLASHASVVVTVSLSSGANLLPSAGYSETISFMNAAETVTYGTRGVTLTVNYPVAQIYTTTIAADGTVQGTLNGTKLSSTSSAKFAPRVAFDGTNYLIVWADNRGNAITSSLYDIYGTRVTNSGARVDGSDIPICSLTSTDQSSPDVVWAGDRYYVSWQDSRSYTGASSYDIYATRIGSNGVVTDANGLLVTSAPTAETRPCLVAGGTNWTGLFYNKASYPIHKLQMRSYGDQVPLAATSIAQLKTAPNGRKVSLQGKVVTAGTTQLSTCFYIEDDDRTGGIRVADTTSAGEAALVDITGTLQTVNGERQLVSNIVSVYPWTGTVPGPLGLGLWSLGGAASGQYVPGVLSGVGVNNIGLLVRVYGKVISTGTGYFMIQDGSALLNGVNADVKVVCPAGVTNPIVGRYVSVTGISSCELSGSDYVHRILARKQADIVTY